MIFKLQSDVDINAESVDCQALLGQTLRINLQLKNIQINSPKT